MGCIGMCGPKGYCFSVVLVVNRVLVLATFVRNRVWFLYFGLDLSMFFFKKTTFSYYQQDHQL